MKRLISILVVVMLLVQGSLVAFAATSNDISLYKRTFGLGKIDELVLSASSPAFTVGLTTVTLTKGGVSTPLTIKSQTTTELVVVIPSSLAEGTYGLVVGDPAGDDLGSGFKGYQKGDIKVGNPTASVVSQLSLPNGYASAYDLTVNGQLVAFESGKTTAEFKKDALTYGASVKSVLPKDDFSKDVVVTVPAGLAAGDYTLVLTTDQEVVEVVNALKVRGLADISASVSAVNQGYGQTQVNITGINTGFSELTTVRVLDGSTPMNLVSGLTVTSPTALSFTLGSGLTPSGNQSKTYKIQVDTGVESDAVDLIVNPTALVLKNASGSAEVSQVSRSGASQSLRVEGINTDFMAGQTSVVLKNAGGTDQVKTSNIAVQDASHLTFDLNQDLAQGAYTIEVATNAQVAAVPLTVVAPSLSGVTYNSIFDVQNGVSLGLGYPLVSVTVTGADTSFTSASSVSLKKGAEVVNGKVLNVVPSGNTLKFDLATGLGVGDYSLSIDVDGSAATTFDTFTHGSHTLNFKVTQASVSSVSPPSIVNLSSKKVTVQGLNTHFDSSAVFTVQLIGPASNVALTTSDVTVVDPLNLSFNVGAGAVASGTYDVKVAMTKGSYVETITKTAGLKVTSMGVKSVTPEYIFADQLSNTIQMVVYGEGVSFNASTSVKIDGVSVTGVQLQDKDADGKQDLVFNLPTNLSAGVRTLKVTHGEALEDYSFVITGNRSLSLTDPSLLTFYDASNLTITGTNINFKLGQATENMPTLKLKKPDQSEVNLVASLSDTKDNVVLAQLPSGLASGNYEVMVEFNHQNSLYGDKTFTLPFVINKRYTALKFYDQSSEIANISKTPTSADLVILTKGIVRGTSVIEDLGSKATLSIKSGSGVVSLTGSTLKFLKAGSAVVEVTCDGMSQTLNITVGDQGASPGETGSPGGVVLPPSLPSDTGSSPATDPATQAAFDDVKSLQDQLENLNGKEAAASATAFASSAVKDIQSLSSPKQAAQLVNEIAKVVSSVLDKPDISLSDATQVVDAYVKNTVTELMSKDKAGTSTDQVTDQVLVLVTKVLKKAGQVTNYDLSETDQGIQVALPAQAVQAAIKSSAETKSKLAASLLASGINKTISNEVSLKIDTAKDLDFKLSKDALKALKDSQASFTLESKGLSMRLSEETLSKSSGNLELTISNKAVAAAVEKSITHLPVSQKGDALRAHGPTFDINMTLTSDGKALAIKPQVSLPLINIDLSKVDVNQLGVYVYNQEAGQWEYCLSRVEGDTLVFNAPHFSMYKVMSLDKAFKDTQNHWAKASINKMVAKHIVSGVSKDMFMPDEKVTRAQFATILVNLLDLESDQANEFSDIGTKDWYYPYVIAAKGHGLIQGVGNGKFDPNAQITREQMATMIGRAYYLAKGYNLKGQADFVDSSSVSTYAKSYVEAMKYHEVINGYSDKTFRPLQAATRAEATTMVKNLYDLLHQ